MRSHLWHPFSDIAAVERSGPFVIVRGEGAYVWDSDGHRMLDAAGGLWFCNVGWGRAELAEAAAAQMRLIPAYHTFGDLATEPTIQLAERLAGMSPTADPDSTKVFFTSGGSDGIDTATKLVRRYWQLRGRDDKTMLVTRTNAYHGMHVAGTALAGIPANVAGYGQLMADVARVAWDDADALAELLADNRGKVAAFVCEPVIGAGGVFAPPAGYLEKVRAVCAEHEVLFVADEVVCGYGRTGSMFASQRWNLEPDLVVTAKGLTSGYLPMGAVLISGHIAETFRTNPGTMWRHGYTYSGHAAAAAVALANLDILERENLVQRAGELQHELAAALAPLAGVPLVSSVRAGVGVLAAVQLDSAALAAHPQLGGQVIAGLRARGVLTRLLATGGLQISPSFVVTRDDLSLLATAIKSTLTDYAGALPA